MSDYNLLTALGVSHECYYWHCCEPLFALGKCRKHHRYYTYNGTDILPPKEQEEERQNYELRQAAWAAMCDILSIDKPMPSSKPKLAKFIKEYGKTTHFEIGTVGELLNQCGVWSCNNLAMYSRRWCREHINKTVRDVYSTYFVDYIVDKATKIGWLVNHYKVRGIYHTEMVGLTTYIDVIYDSPKQVWLDAYLRSAAWLAIYDK